jgi:hypothetical protein
LEDLEFCVNAGGVSLRTMQTPSLLFYFISGYTFSMLSVVAGSLFWLAKIQLQIDFTLG